MSQPVLVSVAMKAQRGSLREGLWGLLGQKWICVVHVATWEWGRGHGEQNPISPGCFEHENAGVVAPGT